MGAQDRGGQATEQRLKQPAECKRLLALRPGESTGSKHLRHGSSRATYHAGCAVLEVGVGCQAVQ